jgi:hypothetical protein
MLVGKKILLKFCRGAYLRYKSSGNDEVTGMTERTELGLTSRDRFIQTAEQELIAFERREREFSKKLRQEEADRLESELRMKAKFSLS